MVDYVKQHYVPKFYLRNFCNSKNLIYCYDKVRGRIYPSSLVNVASEGLFYDVKGVEHAAIEKILSQQEQLFRHALTSLTQTKDVNEMSKNSQRLVPLRGYATDKNPRIQGLRRTNEQA